MPVKMQGEKPVRSGIELASLSDLGCQRENNEDRYSYWEAESDEVFRTRGRLAIVADGMGGYEGGQEASRIAVEAIEEVYSSTLDGDPQSLLVAGFRAAHERIQELAREDSSLHGMGTTCTAVVLLRRRLYYAHVGDSRLYLVRGGDITRLTRDHSYVGRLVESGVISSQEAEIHPQRHILTAALGAGAEVSPDASEEPLSLETGDVLVLCTDGLWGQLTEQEIQDAVTAHPPARACRELVQLARKRGGPDNITLQVIRINGDAAS